MSRGLKQALMAGLVVAVVLCLSLLLFFVLRDKDESAINRPVTENSQLSNNEIQSQRAPLDEWDIENAICYEAANRSKECYRVGTDADETERKAAEEFQNFIITENRASIRTVYHYGGDVYQDIETATNAWYDDAERAGQSKGGIITKWEFNGVTYDEYEDAHKASGETSGGHFFNGQYYSSLSEAKDALEKYNKGE